MIDKNVVYENINDRELFILEISIKNLIDFNSILSEYQDQPYLFILKLGTIIFGEFVSFGQEYRRELHLMKITPWNQSTKFEIDYLNFSSEIVFQLKIIKNIEKPQLIAFSRMKVFNDQG